MKIFINDQIRELVEKFVKEFNDLKNDKEEVKKEKSISDKVIYVFVIFWLKIFDSYVFMMYWTWFIVPLGVIKISMVHAVGLNFMTLFFRSVSSRMEEKSEFDPKDLFMMLFLSLMALGFGYLFHSLM